MTVHVITVDLYVMRNIEMISIWLNETKISVGKIHKKFDKRLMTIKIAFWVIQTSISDRFSMS